MYSRIVVSCIKNSLKKNCKIDRRLEFNSEFARKNNKMWERDG